MKQVTILIGFLFVTQSVFGQRMGVAATVDKQSILIGEQIRLDLEASIPAGRESHFFTLDSIPHFEVLQRSAIDSMVTDKGVRLRQSLTLTSWDSGRWQIPSLSVSGVKTKPIIINVGFSSLDPNQPYHDVKDIIEVQVAQESNWYWYLAGVALLVALFLLFFPGSKKKPERTVAAPPEDAYTTAIREIERLRAKARSEDSKLLFIELIDIFREYLEKRKNIQSFSKTTEDLSVQIGKLPLSADLYRRLVSTLQLSDMVKFARYQPGPAETEESIEQIKNSIDAIDNLK